MLILFKRKKFDWTSVTNVVPGMPSLKITFNKDKQQECIYVSSENSVKHEIRKACSAADQSTEVIIWKRVGLDMSDASWARLCLAIHQPSKGHKLKILMQHVLQGLKKRSNLWKASVIRNLELDSFDMKLMFQVCMKKYGYPMGVDTSGLISDKYGKLVFKQSTQYGLVIQSNLYCVTIHEIIKHIGLTESIQRLLKVKVEIPK
ncbi:hypothetical protein [Paenibacillus sp. 276b]|uniref:hypothetical protein n=1 Tax=Paenibacillus sp. 276b TaxID=1566277 RepID=UPI00089CB13A|nr:hypothetical protein [Paenibacillus sp. 276b]SEB27679.1 hypothetical protein SAMN03159332_6356 [Paenibacillus sp. 276b]